MTDKKSASSKNHEIKKIFKYIAFPDFSPFAPVTVPGFFLYSHTYVPHGLAQPWFSRMQISASFSPGAYMSRAAINKADCLISNDLKT